MEKTNTHRVGRLASMMLAGATLLPAVSQAQELSYAEIAERELLRRRDAVKKADELIKEAREAYDNHDYEKSVKSYQAAIGVLPNGRVMEPRRNHLNEGLAQATVALSTVKIRLGDLKGAQTDLQRVEELDPGNVAAATKLDESYDPIQFTSKVDRVRRHLYKADGYYQLGDYDNAIVEYDKVLLIDPYNQAARRGQQNVHRERRDYYRAAYDETRARLLTEVDRAWEIVPVPVFTGTEPIGGDDGFGKQETTKAVNIQRKLRTIIIPTFDVENTTLTAAITRLSTAIRDSDPEPKEADKGVSFVIRRTEVPGTADGGTIEAPPIRIKQLSLKNVPAEEVLKQLVALTNPRMRFKIEDFVVAVVEATTDRGQTLFSRSYQVPPDFLSRIGDGNGSAPAPDNNDLFGGDTDTADTGNDGGGDKLKATIAGMGIEFQGDKASVRFVRATSTLFITNTAVELDKMEAIIASIVDQVPKQIKITTKFIEVEQQDTDELGFDWIVSPFGLTSNSVFLGGGTVGSGTARTAADFSGTVAGTAIPGLPADGGSVFNSVTNGLRSGTAALSADSIDFFLANPTGTAATTSVAPGILSLTGLFTDGQVQTILRGLSQKTGTDIMNAPSVVARPGETARIEVVRQFIYPTDYDPPQIPNNIGGGNIDGGGDVASFSIVPITPATPTAFEERPTGVILEVTPDVGQGADKQTISLDLEPEIVELSYWC